MLASDNTRVLVVGLGNPGFEYEDTRHNIGFMVVNEVSVRHRCLWERGEGEYLLAHTTVDDRPLLLMKPMTFMNNSGRAVADGMTRYRVPLSNLLVVVDDFWLDAGTIRIRPKGSDGGHNGLRSIIEHLQTEEFARVRCGIRKLTMPPKSEMAEFVLSPFDQDEKQMVDRMIDTAADAVEEFARCGIEPTMNRFNSTV